MVYLHVTGPTKNEIDKYSSKVCIKIILENLENILKVGICAGIDNKIWVMNHKNINDAQIFDGIGLIIDKISDIKFENEEKGYYSELSLMSTEHILGIIYSLKNSFNDVDLYKNLIILAKKYNKKLFCKNKENKIIEIV